MNIGIIVLTVIVIILIYILYKNFVISSSTLVTRSSLKDTNNPIPVTLNPQSFRYSYGLWVYVNSWDNTVYKPIFSRPYSSSNSKSQIYLYLDKTTTTLFFNIACSSGTNGSDIIVTDNFPIQKWVYFVASVDNQFIDLYLDGKLVKSIKLSCIPETPGDANASVVLGTMQNTTSVGTVASDVTVAKFLRWNTPLNPQQVWNNYMSGNGGNLFKNMFSQYGVTVGITNNGVTQSQFSLF
jgi:hypothetical protein